MPVIERIAELQTEMTRWRREIHAYPELGFKEDQTSEFVCKKLHSFGIEIHRGIGKTGVVGVLKGRPSNRTIGLRADMDALPIKEANTFEYRSQNPGIMHACGHDGHTTMLLGAAKYLAEKPNFFGTVYFIFQPAEEGLGGAKRMIEEGLFKKFPMDSIYGLHNWPGLDVGTFAARSGPVMAAGDTFEISVIGKGGHGAKPHLVIDPIICASEIVSALQTITSRVSNPLDSVVVSVTKIHGGDAFNVTPNSVELAGTTRCFTEAIRQEIEESIIRISKGIASAHRCQIECNYVRQFPPTVNTDIETDLAIKTAKRLAGDSNVYLNLAPSMGSEDFSYMLNDYPGCYIWMGNGNDENCAFLHNPKYDFNDEALCWGASYWASLVSDLLIE